MRTHRIAIALLLAAALTACGGTDGEDTTSAPSASPQFDKAAFLTAADAACETTDEEAPGTDKDYTDVSQLQADLDTSVAAIRTGLGKLSALTYPPGAEGVELRRVLVDENKKFLAELESATKQFKTAIADKDEANYLEAADRFIALSDSRPDRTGALKAYGLVGCDAVFGPDPTAASATEVTSADGARCRLFLRAFEDLATSVKALPDRQVGDDDRALLTTFADRTTSFATASSSRLETALTDVAEQAQAAVEESKRTDRIEFKPINAAIDSVQKVCGEAPAPGS